MALVVAFGTWQCSNKNTFFQVIFHFFCVCVCDSERGKYKSEIFVFVFRFLVATLVRLKNMILGFLFLGI